MSARTELTGIWRGATVVAWAVVIGDDEGGWTVARVVTDRARAVDIRDDLTDEPASRPHVRLAAVVIEP